MRPGPGAARVTVAMLCSVAFAAQCGTAASETPTERGAYLVNTVGACGVCHSPKDATGHVAPGTELSGGFEIKLDIAHVVVPNITPDPETGIGTWTEAQIATALRDGRRPDGSIIGPPMPIPAYRSLSDDDTAAIAAFLHSLQPIRHAVARTTFKIPLPASYGPPVNHVDAPARSDHYAYGAYLATFAHCELCHTAVGPGLHLDSDHAFAGGRWLPDIANPGAMIMSRNITADPEQGIGKWSDAQISRAITEGIRPDGSILNSTMPSAWFAGMSPADLEALVDFVRAIPPRKSP